MDNIFINIHLKRIYVWYYGMLCCSCFLIRSNAPGFFLIRDPIHLFTNLPVFSLLWKRNSSSTSPTQNCKGTAWRTSNFERRDLQRNDVKKKDLQSGQKRGDVHLIVTKKTQIYRGISSKTGFDHSLLPIFLLFLSSFTKYRSKSPITPSRLVLSRVADTDR